MRTYQVSGHFLPMFFTTLHRELVTHVQVVLQHTVSLVYCNMHACTNPHHAFEMNQSAHLNVTVDPYAQYPYLYYT